MIKMSEMCTLLKIKITFNRKFKYLKKTLNSKTYKFNPKYNVIKNFPKVNVILNYFF